jgi:dephospho-CoA kinase
MSILVGLTGSIGSGKSLAASYIRDLGAYVIHADLISHQLVNPHEPAWQKIVDNFGSEYLCPDDTLNRLKLATEIFRNNNKRKILEDILHPLVIAEEKKIYSEYKKIDPEAIVIIESALMIESKNYRNVDKVVVIQSNQEIQIQRVMKRDGESSVSIKKRLKLQMPLEEKLQYADYVLYNISSRDKLKTQIDSLYFELKDLAKVININK